MLLVRIERFIIHHLCVFSSNPRGGYITGGLSSYISATSCVVNCILFIAMVVILPFTATATTDVDKAFITNVDGNLQLSAAANRSVIVDGIGDLVANLMALRTANDDFRAMLHALEVNMRMSFLFIYLFCCRVS